MKLVAAMATAVLLSGCGVGTTDQAQVAGLQKQVAVLSQQVQALATRANAVSNLDLQSKCAIDAKRTAELRKVNFSRPDMVDTSNFASHFNAQMQRCFMVINDEMYPGGGAPPIQSESLMDANEQTFYGVFAAQGGDLLTCYTKPEGEKQPCISKAQFEQFAARYMGTAQR